MFSRSPSAVCSSTSRNRPARSTTAATVALGFHRLSIADYAQASGLRSRRKIHVSLGKALTKLNYDWSGFLLIGIPSETAAGETRVAVTAETTRKLIAMGHTVRVQSGAGVAASLTDAAYQAAGAEIGDAAGALGVRARLFPL